MTTDAAMDTLRVQGSAKATVQFWGTGTAPQSFDTLRAALLFLHDRGGDEPLPSVQVHAGDGDVAISGPELEALVKVAAAMRSST